MQQKAARDSAKPRRISRAAFSTARLILRPTEPADADRAYDIQSNWRVTQMLRMASFPPNPAEMEQWFADHAREWNAGEAYRFAVLCDDRMIGVVDIDEIGDGEGELGYWLEEQAWSQGYASEAARAAIDFAFDDVGLRALRSGHADDNEASGRILLKLGFVAQDVVEIPSRSRGGSIRQRRYRLINRVASDARTFPAI